MRPRRFAKQRKAVEREKPTRPEMYSQLARGMGGALQTFDNERFVPELEKLWRVVRGGGWLCLASFVLSLAALIVALVK